MSKSWDVSLMKLRMSPYWVIKSMQTSVISACSRTKLVLSSRVTPVAALWSLFRITFREPTFSLLAPVLMISTVIMLASDACNSPPSIAIISDAVSYSFLNASSRYWLTSFSRILAALIDLPYWFSMRYVSFYLIRTKCVYGSFAAQLGPTLLTSSLLFHSWSTIARIMSLSN